MSLYWNAATDDHTPASGLTYNIRIGMGPGANDICPGMALADGTRLIPAMGNTQFRLTKTIKNLAPGTYCWSVQAIDTCFKGVGMGT